MRRLVAALLLVPATAFAAAERTWSPLVRGYLPAGEADGAAPTSRGTIGLAPATKDLASPPSPYLWSLAENGGRVYAGSGDGGEVWLVPEDGGAAKSLLDPAESQAQALAVLEGKLYAGLNPGGKVVRVQTQGKDKPETVFDGVEEYVWDLQAAKGSLYVAVGAPGRVYRVDPGRAPKLVMESGDGHVRALAWTKDGKLLAGTDGRGLLVRAESDDARFVLFDAPRREISSISVAADGTIWFAAIGQEEESQATPSATPTPVGTPAPIDPKKGPPGQLWRMRPDGFAELVWQSPGPGIYSVLAVADGVLVATGDPGALWLVEADGSSRKLLDPKVGQITTLTVSKDDVLVATANPSKVIRLKGAMKSAAARKGSGTFTATPLDAGGFARWGRLSWEARGKAEVTTRSGNTATPDDSWSKWSKAIPAAGAGVDSPPARFLQYQVKLEGDAELTRLDAVFRVENRAPRVDWIYVEDPGVTIVPKADAPPTYTLPPDAKPEPVRKELPQKRGYARGYRAARWGAIDPDGDALLYDVFLRAEDEKTWRAIAKAIPETYTTWDASSLPDGRYEIKVVASDAAINGEGRTGERVVGPHENDNTPPRVESVSAKAGKNSVTVSLTATDAFGVSGAQASIDGGDWIPLVAKDGVADSPKEFFEGTVPASAGDHVVVVRALDRAGNPGTGKTFAK